MRKHLMLIFFVTTILEQTVLTGWAREDLSAVLNGVREKYRCLPGFRVEYVREVTTRTMSLLGNQVEGDLATGRIYFKPRYHLRLEQKTPEAEILVTDGTTLWWYLPKQEEVHIYSMEKFGQELRLLSDIFQGLANIEDNFKVSLIGETEQKRFLIELTPDPPWENVEKINLLVTSDYDIAVVILYNQLGTMTRFTLEGLRAEEVFEEGFFVFQTPTDVEIIKHN
jgi:outer membrane lipoprotein-sorting protein